MSCLRMTMRKNNCRKGTTNNRTSGRKRQQKTVMVREIRTKMSEADTKVKLVAMARARAVSLDSHALIHHVRVNQRRCR